MKKNKKTICIGVLYVTVLVLVLEFIITPAHVTSGSMEPTLFTNDVVVYNRLSYINNTPDYEDIIWFEHDDKSLCKRVIGTEGDTISFNNGKIYRNGEIVEEMYLDTDIQTDCTETFTVPENCVFVLGDNRAFSFDSRYWENPYVNVSDIKGKLLFIIPSHEIIK